MFVYVLNQHGEPLMPCSPRKARLLLKAGKAKVVKGTPFTIQLRYGSSGYKQPVSLGIDAGTKQIGLSATTAKRVLFEAKVGLRTDMQDLLSTRREFRRARRHRKTRYLTLIERASTLLIQTTKGGNGVSSPAGLHAVSNR